MSCAWKVGWRNILRMIRGQDRDVLLLQPRNDGGIESGISAALSAATKIRSGFLAPAPYSCANEKRVTAIAFPGATETAMYVNMTRESIALRSAPSIKGECNPPGEPVTETTVPAGGRAESLEGCWCCAPAGAVCTPGNKTGIGRALLAACFF